MNYKILRIILLGFILYKFYKITIKRNTIEGWSTGQDNINWSTSNNPNGSPMFNDNGLNTLGVYHQGECGTCLSHSLSNLLSCQYNITKNDGNPICINPQSIIDIIMRYWETPISKTYNEATEVLTKDETYNSNCPPGLGVSCNNGKYCGCGMSRIPKISNLLSETYGKTTSVIYVLECLKKKNSNCDLSNNLGNDIVWKTQFPFPLIKAEIYTGEKSRSDNNNYNIITDGCQSNVVFGETENIAEQSDYNYSEKFKEVFLLDFNIKIRYPFNGSWENISESIFINNMKQHLNKGPLQIPIKVTQTVEGDIERNSAGLLTLESTLGSPNHELTIIGYNGNNVIILNTWPLDNSGNTSSINRLYRENLITERYTFQDIYNHLKVISSPDSIRGVDIELPTSIIPYSIISGFSFTWGHIFLALFVIILLILFVRLFITKREKSRHQRLDRSSTDSTDSSGSDSNYRSSTDSTGSTDSSSSVEITPLRAHV